MGEYHLGSVRALGPKAGDLVGARVGGLARLLGPRLTSLSPEASSSCVQSTTSSSSLCSAGNKSNKPWETAMCVLRTWKPPGGGIWWLTLWAWGPGQQLLYWESKLAWPSRESLLNLRVDSGSLGGRGYYCSTPPTLNCSALWIPTLSLFSNSLDLFRLPSPSQS